MKPDKQSVAGGQIQGGRNYQEDSFDVSFLSQDYDPSGQGRLLLLADGMGGHAGGGVASETAIKAFRQGFYQLAPGLAQRFEAGVDAANELIREKQQADPALGDMGTTLVAAIVKGKSLSWVSVGDSPLWLYREGRLRRLNADHSMRPLLLDLVEMGRLTEEEAFSDPRGHQLRSAIYGESIPLIDMNADGYALEDGDRVLLASDGLETLSEPALAEAIDAGGNDADAMVRALLGDVTAVGRPGQDNATVVVCRVGPEDTDQPETAGKAPGKENGLLDKVMDVLSGNRGAQK